MGFVVSIKKSQNGLVIVITDLEILGKIFEEGNVQLDLTKKFYQGDEMNKEEIIKLISKARHIHLTGKKSIELAKKLNLVGEKILHVQGIPHAEVLLD